MTTLGDDDLRARLGRLGPQDQTSWQARLFDPLDPADRAALELVVHSGALLYVHDALAAQLGELVEIRAPHRKLTPAELELEVAAFLDGRDPFDYGSWVHYPWARRLVHVLPKDEYREVRTSRNRNKITADEQARLGALTVGVAGLSVGQATAVTLALEGIGGRFRLADFDTLNLSNMNRLRAGVQAIGVNKAVLTAREIFEIDPYAEVTLFSDGVRESNLEAFLDGLDLLFEECDDLRMKVRLREAARHKRIPVLMETSDRGLFDLERFDREPERPLFHGLVGDLKAETLDGLTTRQKVPVVLGIIGARTMSQRMAASLLDIEASIKSWPQLASAVALGGAINADAARRVVLGELVQSGRFFVDLGELVADGKQAATEPPKREEQVAPIGEPELPPLVAVVRATPAPSLAELRAIVAHGAQAPSGGNCQPWQFVFRGGALDCVHDVARSRSLLDYGHAASYLAFGAAVENMALAARQLGLGLELEPFPDAADERLVCRARFVAGDVGEGELARMIGPRATNRRLGARVPLAEEDLRALVEAAGDDANLQLLESADELDELARILGRGDRLRFLSATMHREMMHEMRLTPDEARRTRDGIDLDTLELDATDRAGMQLLSSWPVMETAARLGGGVGLETAARKAVAASSAMGLLTVAGSGPRDYLRGGRALERLWLAATARGLAFQPLTILVYLFLRLEKGNGDGLSQYEIQELSKLRTRYRALFEIPKSHVELMLFRIGRAAPPTVRSLRRPLDDILRIE